MGWAARPLTTRKDAPPMYIANRQITHHGKTLAKGTPLPDAHTWHNIETLVRKGWVVIDPEIMAKAAELVKAERERSGPPKPPAQPPAAPSQPPTVPQAPTRRAAMRKG